MKRLALMLSLAVAGLLAACGDRIDASSAAIVSQVPFADGERLIYGLHDDAGMLIARGTLTARRDRAGGLLLEQAYEDTNPRGAAKRATDVATLVVDAETLRPRALTRTVERSEGNLEYWATYAEDGSNVELVHAADEEPRTLKLPEHAYDNESSLWLWRSLPFADDYEQRYVSVNSVERSRQAASVAVTGRERIEVPAGAFETWRLQVRNGRATRVAWINVEAPHEVVQWDNGTIVFRLEATR